MVIANDSAPSQTLAAPTTAPPDAPPDAPPVQPQPAAKRPRRRRHRPPHHHNQHATGSRGPTAFSRQHPVVDLIFNEVSGTRDPDSDLRLITDTLTASFASLRIWRTTPTDSADLLASRALAAGASLLVACGGDGTVTAVASAIHAHETRLREGRDTKHPSPSASDSASASASASASGPTPELLPSPSRGDSDLAEQQPLCTSPMLAVVPRGTANALCAALHVPSQVRTAADMVCTGPTRRVDFPRFTTADGVSDGGVTGMLLLCGVGLEAEAVGRADRRLKRAIGAAAYAVAGLSSIWQQRAFTTELVLHDVHDSLMFAHGAAQAGELRLRGMRLHGVTVANAAPPASVLAQGIGEVRPDDGLLEVVCIEAIHPLGMIRTMVSMLGSALMRTRRARRNVYGLRARKVEIVCDPPQKVVVDGEEAGLTPITVELRGEHDAITVVAPKAGKVTREKRKLSRFLGRLCRNVRGLVLFAVAISLLQRSRQKRLASR